MSVQLDVRGLDDLKRALRDLPSRMKKNILRSAVRAGAVVFANEARRLAPSDSGQLKHSIRVSTKPTATGVIGRVSVGSRDTVYRKGRKTKTPYKRAGTNGGVVYNVAYYARWVEFGTKLHVIKAKKAKALTVPGSFARAPFRKSVIHPGAKPNPFMRTAAVNKAGAALNAFIDYASKRFGDLNKGAK